jgi:hypothetical protein
MTSDRTHTATGAPAASATITPAWRSRRIAGVDTVPGDPPVPLSVWYIADDDDRPVAADPAVDGWPGELARQTVAGLTSPGDLIVDLDSDDAVRVAALDARCNYRPLVGGAHPHRSATATATADLVALRWPRPPARPNNPLPTTAVDLLGACRTLLGTGGCIAVAMTPPPADLAFVDPAPGLLAAAPAAGLGYLQHIVNLDRALTGAWLTNDPPPSHPRPAVFGRSARVHRDVIVLVLRAVRHG